MALSTKTFLSSALLAVTLSLALSSVACGPVVPVTPTWQDDIRPLMVSRCTRCHSDPGRVDPYSAATNPILAIKAIPNLDYPTYGDLSAGGMITLIKLSAQAAKGQVPMIPRMPPPPAEALDDWQIEMLQAWVDYPQ